MCHFRRIEQDRLRPREIGLQFVDPRYSSAATTALQAEVAGSSLYITEIFYNYTASTPITQFLQGSALPTQLYSVTYY